jgi:hypothetical protein
MQEPSFTEHFKWDGTTTIEAISDDHRKVITVCCHGGWWNYKIEFTSEDVQVLVEGKWLTHTRTFGYKIWRPDWTEFTSETGIVNFHTARETSFDTIEVDHGQRTGYPHVSWSTSTPRG